MSAIIDVDAMGTGAAFGRFGARKRRGANTDARLALLAELWPSMMPVPEILAQLDALPGLRPVTYDHAVHWAGDLGVHRPKEATHAVVLEKWRAKRVMTEPPEATAERNDVLRRLATGSWSFDVLSRLCTLWLAGHSTAEIGRYLGVTKNAVVGKAHRLIAAGVLTSRESPIIRDGIVREPKLRVRVRPKVTLPPLPSAENVAPMPPPARFNPALLPRAGSLGPMRVDFRSPLPRVPVIEKPARQWIADDGSAATGPSQRPCQFVVRDGSLTKTWIFCGMPAARGAWCADHRAVCYINVRRAVAA